MMAIRILPEVLQKTCELHLGEICTRRDDDIKTVQYWLDQQPHLKSRRDVQWLLSFLRGCEFSFEEVYHKLDLYYTARTLVPEFFSNRNPFLPQVQEFLNLGVFLPLKKVNEVGERIIVVRVGLYDPQKAVFENLLKVYLMVSDILLNEDDDVAVNGCRYILDMKGVTFAHLKSISLITFLKGSKCYVMCSPVKIKGVHCINNNSASTKLMTVAMNFFSEYVNKRMYFYNSETFHELFAVISKNILPVEYGGSAESLVELAEEVKEKVESYCTWFEDDAQYCTIEGKRFGGAQTIETVFGGLTNFQNLTID